MRGPDRKVREALDDIMMNDERGQLRPEAVVEHAVSPKSAIHHCFTWDDRRASHNWRLHEARVLIRTYTVVIDQDPTPIKTRAYVSLRSARVQGTGYTPIRRVLSDATMHAELLQNALQVLEEAERRYGHLMELRAIFQEVRKVRRRTPKHRPTHAAA